MHLLKHHLATMLYACTWRGAEAQCCLGRGKTYSTRQSFIHSSRNLAHDVFGLVGSSLKLPIVIFPSQNHRQILGRMIPKSASISPLKLVRLCAFFFQFTRKPSTCWPEMSRFTVTIKLTRKCIRNPSKCTMSIIT